MYKFIITTIGTVGTTHGLVLEYLLAVEVSKSWVSFPHQLIYLDLKDFKS